MFLGFRRVIAALEPRYTLPSDSWLRKTLIPELYDGLCKDLMNLMESASFVSCTTDTWSTAQCTDSLLSVTVHWVDADWVRRSALLAASPIVGSHTAENIKTVVTGVIAKWNLAGKVHVFVRDNAKNMTSGLRDAGVHSLPCLSHTLQLCVKRGLTSQRAVSDALAVGRHVATHFSHSVLAKEKLELIQQTLSSVPERRIIQDVSTRWNSTYYMAQRLVEQKRALILYAADNTLSLPDANQWMLLERSSAILAPIERATKDVSAESSTASDVIPLVIGIKRALQLLTNDAGVQTMKKELEDDMDVRFANITSEPLYAVATLVDPRYRGKLFSVSELAAARQWLIDQVTSVQMPEGASPAADDVQQPDAKRPRVDEILSPLDLLAADLLGGDTTSAQSGQLTAAEEVDAYLRQPNIPRQQSPLLWWKLNERNYVRVAEVARRYLSAPSTSVASERLFSSAGEMYSDTRSRLAPERAEMLLFINQNMKLF